ncbi:septum formation initiator [Micromonospora sp. NBC_01796]|uniref:septum formation initiator n=1 Tax=Micromonospora sp. NBC_01796 TaxID=2975987 RepID=UPI002DD91F1A|nr:septum formation initiator [Micromonospora sp. NBC_01796]WSA83478.1 septum formation initiator [Micromonospora sp. NBC_01796]
MARRTLLALAGWLVAAAAATGTGLAAVELIGAELTGPAGEVRSADEVARALAAPARTPLPPGDTAEVPAATPTAGPSGSAGPTPPASDRVLSTPGGTVVAQCRGDDVWLVSWAPAQGYAASEVERGPDDDAEVTFESSARKIEVRVRCEAGQPVESWSLDDD